MSETADGGYSVRFSVLLPHNFSAGNAANIVPLYIWYGATCFISRISGILPALTIAAGVRRVAEMLRSVFIAGALPQ